MKSAVKVEGGGSRPPAAQTLVKSSMAFYGVWKSMSSAEEKFSFLDGQMNTPKSYRTLFSHSLEPEVFEDIVEVLHDRRNDGADICRHLLGLSQVPRVSALVMFMDNKGKLQELVDKHVIPSSTLEESQIQSIRECFS